MAEEEQEENWDELTSDYFDNKTELATLEDEEEIKETGRIQGGNSDDGCCCCLIIFIILALTGVISINI